MNESPREHINLGFEDYDKLTSRGSVQLKAFRIHTGENSGHLINDQSNLYDTLNFKKAPPAQGSNRALSALVMIVCLISLAALLLTILMSFGIMSPSKEGTADSVLAKIKSFEKNITSQQLDLLENHDFELSELKLALNRTNANLAERNRTYSKHENLDSASTDLKSALKTTNYDLAELNSTRTKGKVIYHQTMTPSWIKAHASYINGSRGFTTEQITFDTDAVYRAALIKVPMIPVNVLQNSTPLTVKMVVSTNVTIASNSESDVMYGVSDGESFVGFETLDKKTNRYPLPCYGSEGVSLNSRLKNYKRVSSRLPRPSDSFYPGQVVGTLSLNERWGSCYTAHDGGFANTAVYSKRLTLSKGLTFEVYKNGRKDRVGIKFIEVTIMQYSQR